MESLWVSVEGWIESRTWLENRAVMELAKALRWVSEQGYPKFNSEPV